MIDAGGGQKLERFGAYTLVRPESQAIWVPQLAIDVWQQADATFHKGRGDDGPGHWSQRRPMPEQWLLHYDNLKFWVRLTPFKHTGVFPEHSAHWAWLHTKLASAARPPNVLALFGYTGLSTLVAAAAGARVTHVDASKPAMRWAQENQEASGLRERPVRWIVDDVAKFVAREERRGSRYDLIMMDPPVFGRGPKGEIWRLSEALPALIDACVRLLSERPLGFLLSAYATNISSLTLYNLLEGALHGYGGALNAGELVVPTTTRQILSTAIYACWESRK